MASLITDFRHRFQQLLDQRDKSSNPDRSGWRIRLLEMPDQPTLASVRLEAAER